MIEIGRKINIVGSVENEVVSKPSNSPSEVITGVPNTNKNAFNLLCGMGFIVSLFGIGMFYKYQKQS